MYESQNNKQTTQKIAAEAMERDDWVIKVGVHWDVQWSHRDFQQTQAIIWYKVV